MQSPGRHKLRQQALVADTELRVEGAFHWQGTNKVHARGRLAVKLYSLHTRLARPSLRGLDLGPTNSSLQFGRSLDLRASTCRCTPGTRDQNGTAGCDTRPVAQRKTRPTARLTPAGMILKYLSPPIRWKICEKQPRARSERGQAKLQAPATAPPRNTTAAPPRILVHAATCKVPCALFKAVSMGQGVVDVAAGAQQHAAPPSATDSRADPPAQHAGARRQSPARKRS